MLDTNNPSGITTADTKALLDAMAVTDAQLAKIKARAAAIKKKYGKYAI